MKLIILILIVLAGLPSESYRLPALNVRVKIEDPLFLAKFVNAIKSLLADTDIKKGSILSQLLTSNATQHRILTNFQLRI